MEEAHETHVLTFVLDFLRRQPVATSRRQFFWHKYRSELHEFENHWHICGDRIMDEITVSRGSRREPQETLHLIAIWKRMNLWGR